MDKTFNFFKTKIKAPEQRPRNNNSKSNSSKASYSKQSDKAKAPLLKPGVLTKREKQIREAIEMRYQKSKLRHYEFTRANDATRRQLSSSRSVDQEEYKQLKGLHVVDLKQYHRRRESLSHSNQSSQEKKKFNLRLKLRDNSSNMNILRTEGDEMPKHGNSGKLIKNATPNRPNKTEEEWRFISIQLKQELSKFNNRKTDVKINSHRSYNLQQERPKLKSNSSVNKYTDKLSVKAKEGPKPAKTRF